MNLQSLDQDLRELLAAEYALGTLRGRARARLARELRDDADLRQRVAFWEERLTTLSAPLQEVQPDAKVWEGIQQRLGFIESPAHPSTAQPFWQRFGRYMVSAAALVMLIVGVQITAPPIEDGTTGATAVFGEFTAEIVISNEWGGEQWRIRGVPGQRFARLEVIQNPPIGEDRDLEMWFIADSGSAPVSLWLCPDEPGATVDIELPQPLQQGSTFAVSLEPEGGSPDPGPSGPVLFAQTYTG